MSSDQSRNSLGYEAISPGSSQFFGSNTISSRDVSQANTGSRNASPAPPPRIPSGLTEESYVRPHYDSQGRLREDLDILSPINYGKYGDSRYSGYSSYQGDGDDQSNLSSTYDDKGQQERKFADELIQIN